MALIDDVRSCLHVSSDKTDVEIQMWIDSAIDDMRRCGVKESLLNPSTMNSLAKSAVVMFTKARYGFDNSEADRFESWYQATLASLLNSKANEYLFPDEPNGEGDG